MSEVRENKMGTAPVPGLILSMSLPAMLSMLIQSLYNVVDSIFVARLGENALTAVSLVYPVQMLLVAAGVGTGVGMNSLISRRLGEKRREEANQAAEHGLVLGAALWVLFALMGLFFTKPFFASFTDDAEIVSMACDYSYIVLLFSFGGLIQMIMEKTLQATGNMIFSMVVQIVGAVANIILDPIMIFGLLGCPALGVAGAAIATVIGQILAMALGLVFLFCFKHGIQVDMRRFRFRWRTVRDIYAVGFPAIIMQSIGSVLTVALNGILIGYSSAAVAVLGIYFKLQSFVFMPVFGLNQGVMPIMGYNYGARNYRRLCSTYKLALLFAFILLGAGALLFGIFPRQLMMIFDSSEAMLKVGIPALRIISYSFWGASFGIMTSTLFQAVGQGVYSMLVSILRQLAVILPAAWLLGRFWGLDAIWYAFPIAELAGVGLTAALLIRVYRRKLQPMRAEEQP
ncbi:MAG: MATE family efflux transporter [Oscillospiraceae bacterium]|nr:MATE family efflux transporter [Oscillospiraceae bacterium]MDY4191961.1 MATE family efflux transporter [Oscillospiraceae bacterium]